MKNKNKEKITLKRYFKMFSGIKMPWFMLFLSVLVPILSYYFSSNITYITGAIINSSGIADPPLLMEYTISMVIVALLGSVSTIVSGVTNGIIEMRVRQKVWNKLMYLPHRFYDSDKGEALVSRVTEDCSLSTMLISILVGSVTMVYGIGLYIRNLFILNSRLAWYSVAIMIPSTILVGLIFAMIRYGIGRRTQAAVSESTAYLVERTRNLNLIRAAGTQDDEVKAGAERFQTQFKTEMTDKIVGNVSVFFEQIPSYAVFAVVFIAGAALIEKGLMSAGLIVAFYTFSNIMGIYLGIIAGYGGTVKHAFGALERVIEIMEAPIEDLDSGDEMDVPDCDIHFDNVSFAYGEKNVLNDLSCVIPKHKVTAVIGANGSGKTTLFKLLERFYDPSEGAVFYGDTQAAKFNLHAWRKAFGYVPQSNAIMEGTIRSNITYGSEYEIPNEELKEILKMANLTDLVESLPDGIDTYVAPGGTNFSGGQRQLIAIARVLLRNPDYLLLDEATSNLDNLSERTVTEAMRNLMKDRTTIVIAHDLNTIRKADYVLQIKDGKIAASGTPEEILATSDLYGAAVVQHGAAAQNDQ